MNLKIRCPKCKRLVRKKKFIRSRINFDYICHGCYYLENMKINMNITEEESNVFHPIYNQSIRKIKPLRLANFGKLNDNSKGDDTLSSK